MISCPMYKVLRYFCPLKDAIQENMFLTRVSTHGKAKPTLKPEFYFQANRLETKEFYFSGFDTVGNRIVVGVGVPS